MNRHNIAASFHNLKECVLTEEAVWGMDAIKAFPGFEALTQANRVILTGSGVGMFAARAGHWLWQTLAADQAGDRIFCCPDTELAHTLLPGDRVVCLGGKDQTENEDSFCLPLREDGDLLSGYITSLIQVQGAVCALAQAWGFDEAREYKKVFDDYVNLYDPQTVQHILTATEQACQALAPAELADLLAEGPMAACRDFARTLAAQCWGGVCMWDNSEDWHHINFFQRQPETIVTVCLYAAASGAAFRQEETVSVATQIHRQLLVITDAEPIEGVSTIRLPRCSREWPLLLAAIYPAALIMQAVFGDRA